MAANPTGIEATATAPYQDQDGDWHFNGTTVYMEASPVVFAEGTVKAMVHSAAVAVAVPTIAAAKVDFVAVDVSAASTFACAVGDAVVAIPTEALPTDCVLLGAYVTAADEVTLTFGTKEGGGGVTGANKNFKFLFFDLT